MSTTIACQWLNLKQGAQYVGFTSIHAHMTIQRWIRRGWIPEEYIGQRGKELIVKPEGLDLAVKSIRARRRPGR